MLLTIWPTGHLVCLFVWLIDILRLKVRISIILPESYRYIAINARENDTKVEKYKQRGQKMDISTQRPSEQYNILGIFLTAFGNVKGLTILIIQELWMF